MKILLVTSRYPWPPRRGDQMRAVQQLDFLTAEHEVTLLTPEPGPGQPPPSPDAPYRVETYRQRGHAAALSGMGRAVLKNLPLQSGLFYQPDLGRKLRALAPAHDLGILQLVRLAIHLGDFGETPLLVDLIDSLSLNFSLRADVDRRWLRPVLRLEAHLLALWERRLVERAAGVLVVCERDRQALENRLPPELARKVTVVRLAMRERTPEHAPAEPPVRVAAAAEGRPVLMITGNLGYFVNVDAVTWWLAEVWPEIRKRRPDVRVVVAGDRPQAVVRRAVAEAGEAVELIASPPDLRSLLQQATLALAPMRCGSGVPIKVLEAWSVGVPVVASPWAVAGTTGRQGEDFWLVGHPIEWVRAILDLLGEPAERERLGQNGRRRLAADYSRPVVRGQLLASLRALALPASPAEKGAETPTCAASPVFSTSAPGGPSPRKS
ncbi:MAG TPA: glycosyltransferase family 4 protein [Thermoanaerobaculia bacterium]|nr:glycosyltransferase family 4 protein [Thermoanaerobaculia bacterium]